MPWRSAEGTELGMKIENPQIVTPLDHSMRMKHTLQKRLSGCMLS